MAQTGLQLLIDCDPRELHRKRSDGRRVIDTLHEALISQNLIKDPQWALTSQSGTHAGPPTQTAEQQYRDVFDAALEHGLGVWVQDFVELVCGDVTLTSNDPLEAFLLDGGFVRSWARSRLQRLQKQLGQALDPQAAALSGVSLASVTQQLGQLNVVAALLLSLDRICGTFSSGSSSSITAGVSTSNGRISASGGARLSTRSDVQQAKHLQQCLQVVSWCTANGLFQESSIVGAFPSHAVWSLTVQQRRQQNASTYFLDGLVRELRIEGAYPFASPHAALAAVFLVRGLGTRVGPRRRNPSGARDPPPVADTLDGKAGVALGPGGATGVTPVRERQPPEELPASASPGHGHTVTCVGDVERPVPLAEPHRARPGVKRPPMVTHDTQRGSASFGGRREVRESAASWELEPGRQAHLPPSSATGHARYSIPTVRTSGDITDSAVDGWQRRLSLFLYYLLDRQFVEVAGGDGGGGGGGSSAASHRLASFGAMCGASPR
ncbi:MAG: hypothetical protein WDW38_011388 [Sanguina aurantia]